MNDQISTVSAGQDVFTSGQCGPHEAVLEQRVAGSFFDFSLTHPARSEGAAVQQRERPRRSVTANQTAPCHCQGRRLRNRCGAKRSSLDRDLEGSAHADLKCRVQLWSEVLLSVQLSGLRRSVLVGKTRALRKRLRGVRDRSLTLRLSIPQLFEFFDRTGDSFAPPNKVLVTSFRYLGALFNETDCHVHGGLCVFYSEGDMGHGDTDVHYGMQHGLSKLAGRVDTHVSDAEGFLKPISDGVGAFLGHGKGTLQRLRDYRVTLGALSFRRRDIDPSQHCSVKSINGKHRRRYRNHASCRLVL